MVITGSGPSHDPADLAHADRVESAGVTIALAFAIAARNLPSTPSPVISH